MRESGNPANETGEKGNRLLYNFQRRFEDFKGKVIRMRNLYCECGYPVRVKEIWDGTEWSRTIYDTDKDLQLAVCPGCQAAVDKVALKASAPKSVI